LSINNTAYFKYLFNITGVELVGSARSFYELENVTQENISLKSNEYFTIPIKLNKTSNDTNLPINKIEIKLTGIAPVYDVFYERGHNYTYPFEIYFEIPITQPPTSNPDNKDKIITGVIIGSASTYFVKKRRKN